MTKLQSIQEAFQQRIVTDEFDPNATYNIKERDLEWLFSHIKELENKYQTETELRATWERQALHYGYHLRKAQEIALEIQISDETYNQNMEKMMQRYEIEELLSDEYRIMYLTALHNGWSIYRNDKKEFVAHMQEEQNIMINVEQFKKWLKSEMNS